ncbi:hypothetical protein, partial [Mesorhizobium sp. M7A.F.Ca.CA.002.04.1.1]|uniref:hypothetical protein n=1 Tax=Mesorhizobium sp. M7A.F.Ca.CA.002.04.1.1 TaxID=2496681 RepID=UPI0019D4746B
MGCDRPFPSSQSGGESGNDESEEAGEDYPHRPLASLNQHAHRVLDQALEGDQQFGTQRTVD